MADRRVNKTAPIIAAEEAVADLCQDLDHWPHSWRIEDADLAFGHGIIEFLRPFLFELLAQRPARKTFLRHRDHLWMLGGEIVRRRNEDPAIGRKSIEQIVLQLIDGDCGPLLWPRISEPQQNAFDATCRKLYKFLTATSACTSKAPKTTHKFR